MVRSVHHRWYPVLVITMLWWSGCGIDALPPEPARDNPVDPIGTVFDPPESVFISGPEYGAVLDTNAVTFIWKGKQSDDRLLYSYSLRNGGWSPYDTVKRVTFADLEEGTYMFLLRTRYRDGVEQQYPKAVSYTVDDLHGSVLRFFPRWILAPVNSEYTFTIRLDSIPAITGVKTVIRYDPKKLSVRGTPVIFTDTSSILYRAGGTIIGIVETDSIAGTITLNAAGTGTATSAIRSGALARITFATIATGRARHTIRCDAAIQLRTADNGTVTVDRMVPAVMEVP